MKLISKDKKINLTWTVLKGAGAVAEDFSQSKVALFVESASNRWAVSCTADAYGVVSAVLPDTLPEAVYNLRLIWIKNENNILETRCLQRTGINQAFAINAGVTSVTTDPEELAVESTASSYGYDGLSAYELAVLRGDFSGTEEEYIKDAPALATKYAEVLQELAVIKEKVFPLTVTFSANPTVAEYTGSDVAVSLNWVIKRDGEEKIPTSLSIKRSGTEIGSPSPASSGTFNSYVTTLGATTFELDVIADGTTSQTTASVELVRKMYFGFTGSTAPTDLTILASQYVKSSPNGTYTVNNATEGNYLWLCIGDNKSINALKNTSNFDIPFSLIKTEGGYKYYRSDSGIEKGNMTFVIS